VIRLRVTDGEGSREVDLDGDRIVIGRTSEADLTIDSPDVSREHAELVRGRGGWYVSDLGSSNGTFVNGERTDRATVSAGDVVGLGDAVQLELLPEQEFGRRGGSRTRDTDADERRAGIVRSLVLPGLLLLATLVSWLVASLTHMIWLGILLGLLVAAVLLWWLQPRQLALLVVQGCDADGQWFEIFELPMRIGAASDNDIRVPGGTVSGRHCRLVRGEEGIVVVDEGSTHGTFVNDERVTQRKLAEDDVLRVGDLELVYEERL